MAVTHSSPCYRVAWFDVPYGVTGTVLHWNIGTQTANTGTIAILHVCSTRVRPRDSMLQVPCMVLCSVVVGNNITVAFDRWGYQLRVALGTKKSMHATSVLLEELYR